MSSPATNVVESTDLQNDIWFVDRPGGTFVDIVSRDGEGLLRIPSSVNTAATLRLNQSVHRITASFQQMESSGVGGERVGRVTVFTEGSVVDHFDSFRQGKNIQNLRQFSKTLLPQITVNRSDFLTRKNRFNYRVQQIEYGQSTNYKTYDENKKKFIPFEDFPGKLNPVDLVKAGDYTLQYMIITDLTRDMNQFVNPDNLDGAIEVFESKESFANTGFSDIQVRGFKASLTNQNYFETGFGASPIENRYELTQKKHSFFEDSADLLFTDETFSNKLGYAIATASLALPGFVSDTQRVMSPFSEQGPDIKFQYNRHLRDFVETTTYPQEAAIAAFEIAQHATGAVVITDSFGTVKSYHFNSSSNGTTHVSFTNTSSPCRNLRSVQWYFSNHYGVRIHSTSSKFYRSQRYNFRIIR